MNNQDINDAVLIALYEKIKKLIDANLNESNRFAAELFDEVQTIQGAQGERGERGPQGIQGEKGDVGEKGDKGDQGDTGERGPVGPQGEKGETGDTGPVGARGEKGDTGPIGPQGDHGERGEKGEQGPQGVKGDTGPQGPQGEKGDRGDVGPQGAKGPKGDKGDQGIQGPQGLKGKDGKQGPKGDKGDKGDRGEQGEKGDTGPQGEQGPAGKDAEVPDLTPHIDKVEKNFKKWQDNVNKSLSTIGGGGSYSILDMKDVEYKKRSDVEGDSILVYYPDKKKFVSESFLDVLERLKAELEVQYDRRVDFEGSFTYVGEAVPGSDPAQPVWRIKRIEEFGGDKDMDILWADGTADQIKVWDDRATYTY